MYVSIMVCVYVYMYVSKYVYICVNDVEGAEFTCN